MLHLSRAAADDCRRAVVVVGGDDGLKRRTHELITARAATEGGIIRTSRIDCRSLLYRWPQQAVARAPYENREMRKQRTAGKIKKKPTSTTS